MENLDETASVISAAKVTGTNVYNTDGEHLGEIQDVMIDKRSGKIAYAVLVVWRPARDWPTVPSPTVGHAQVRYPPRRLRGRHNADQLKGAPTYGANEMPAWGDRAYETRIHDYYKAVPYWGV